MLYSPGVASVALAMPSGESAALSDPSVAPSAHLVMMIAGVAAATDGLDLGDLLTPLGVEHIETAWNHQPVHHLDDTIKRLFHLRGAIIRADPQNFDAWKQAIVASSAGRTAPLCPILMCVDSFNGGAVVPVAWQDAYAQIVAGLGASIERLEFPHDDHFSLPGAAAPQAQAWLATRLHS